MKRLVVLATVVLALVAGFGVGASVIISIVCAKSPLRAALPHSSRDVHEDVVDFVPDYVRFLKARMSRSDFDGFVGNLDLTAIAERQPGRRDAVWISWGWEGIEPSWWDCSEDIEGTYWKVEGRDFVLAKYEKGWAYAQMGCH